MKILLIGPQGSGKSTQGKKLSESLGIPYISTGDIFRKIAQTDPAVKQMIESGRLVDDETTIKLVRERLTESDCQNGFILDGYPRNVEQAQALNLNFDKVIYINVSERIVVERLLNRGRVDDTEQGIKKRLNLYKAQTQLLLDLYENILVEIDGTGSIEKVQDEIKKSI